MFKQWISQLKDFIAQLRGVQLQNRGGYYSVKFTYKVSDHVSLEVDLLVSPHWDTPRDFYEFLKIVREEYRIK